MPRRIEQDMADDPPLSTSPNISPPGSGGQPQAWVEKSQGFHPSQPSYQGPLNVPTLANGDAMAALHRYQGSCMASRLEWYF